MTTLMLRGDFGLEHYPVADRADRFRVLLRIYDALLGPLGEDTSAARELSHPDVSALKWRFEQDWLEELYEQEDELPPLAPGDDVITVLRKLAALTRIPEPYRWVANDANRAQVLAFIAAEGGPDGGFDDLVAVAQVGLSGQAKLEMATNYWDEMGNGELAEIHTDLHRITSQELELTHPAPESMSEWALERAALGGLMATNHWLQPEMLGVLGMIELQAGPRCQQVLKAMRRHGMSVEAQAFYQIHADVDPRHGADWLTKVIAPTIHAHPTWSERILRGARWRLTTNERFLHELHGQLA